MFDFKKDIDATEAMYKALTEMVNTRYAYIPEDKEDLFRGKVWYLAEGEGFEVTINVRVKRTDKPKRQHKPIIYHSWDYLSKPKFR